MKTSPSLENAKLKKWLELLPNLDLYIKNNKKKLKKKIRKGIPDSLRGEIWFKISGASKIWREKIYDEYLNRINENEMIKIPDEATIIKDIDRTYPKNLFFLNKLGEGQRSLFRILSCLSIKNKKIGYVQGMSFFAAIFSTYLNEEKSFWMMEIIMKNYHLQEIYNIGFPGLKKNLFVFLKLMKKIKPNLFRKLLRHNIHPTIYASSWYLTCFSNVLPYDIVLRIMDCFLFEGSKIIHRFSLGLLSLKENEILEKKNFIEIMGVLKSLPENIDIDKLFKKSFDFSITRKKILKYENLYKDILNGNGKKENQDIMNQIKI